MFLCLDCKLKTHLKLKNLNSSEGPCEKCGKVTVCLEYSTEMTCQGKLVKLQEILDIDTVGWASPRVLIETIQREVLDK